MASEDSTGDVAFRLIEGVDQLSKKAAEIRSDNPRSASVYNSLLVKIKGYSDTFNFYALKKHPSSRTIFLKAKATQNSMAVYCPIEDEHLFLEALKETTFIDWSQKMICFQYVPETLVAQLKLVMEKKSKKMVGKSEGDLYVYDSTEDAGKFVIPAGFTLKRMGAAAVEQMHAVWKYNACSQVKTFLELCKHAPNAALYRSGSAQEEEVDVLADGLKVASDEEKAVAWASSTEYGPLGLLGVDSSVEDDKVKADLERLVVRACALLMIREDYVVHSYLEIEDTTIKAMKGWSKQGFGTWVWCCDGQL
ncbi:hypothetical protein FHG87_017882 [Trinorchestia longiramus]|nr:hypothetical protein FHG87_017882 [Trinorchestia longiramus]